MRFEPKTLLFDFIMIIVFIIIGLFWFNVITFGGVVLKVIMFALVVLATGYFGCFRNHNYTKIACESQGKADIQRGKVISNLEVNEQTVDANYKGVDE